MRRQLKKLEMTFTVVYQEQDAAMARTGTYTLKTWGQNNGSDNTTPSYYEGDTSPGMSYTFGGYGNTMSSDSLGWNIRRLGFKSNSLIPVGA